MKRVLCSGVLLFLLATPLAAEAGAAERPAGLSGGIGLGYTGLMPLSESAGLFFVNLRAGGFFQYSLARLGPGTPGMELGAWFLALPVLQGIFMLEAPVLLTYDLPLGPSLDLTLHAGYCLLLGSGESTEVSHAGAAGLRLSWRRLYAQGSALFIVDPGSVPAVAAVPHFEAGWRIR